jgi:hypothetical protein
MSIALATRSALDAVGSVKRMDVEGMADSVTLRTAEGLQPRVPPMCDVPPA